MNDALIKKTLLEKFKDIMPKGAGALFFIQIFSTLAFSVLYSTLVLYVTNKLHLSDTTATNITATFVAFNYALHLLGGLLGGRFLSYRSLFAVGMVAIAIGCVFISFPTTSALYWGLAAFLVGAGLNVTCINCMLTQLFSPNDKRREAAFLWNYSGMNVGFFVGFSLSGYYQLTGDYSRLFLLSSLGSIIALVLIIFQWKSLGDINTRISQLSGAKKHQANLNGIGLICVLLISLRWILENSSFSNSVIMFAGVVMAGVVVFLAMAQPNPEHGKKIWGFFILALTSLVFWALYQLAPMGLTLFAERNVDRHFLGYLIAPQWIQNINTIVIIIGGPLLSVCFTKMRARGIKLTLPIQFMIALFLIGIAFVILPIGIHFANAQGYCNFNWIAASYILQSAGELFISPIGYAMVGQLAPTSLQGVMMGTWMMIIGVGATLSSYFSNLALGANASTDPLITNASFSHIFSMLGWISIGTGVILFVLLPIILRLTQERQLQLDMNVITK